MRKEISYDIIDQIAKTTNQPFEDIKDITNKNINPNEDKLLNPVDCNIQSSKDSNKKQYFQSSYFQYSELACKATGIVKLAPGFAAKLNQLREKWGRPMIVNSCCRSKLHNDEIKANPRSFHIYDYPHYQTKGSCAIDIKIKDPHLRGKLASLAWSCGWSIGINKNFIHLDRRTDYTKLKQTLFLY